MNKRVFLGLGLISLQNSLWGAEPIKTFSSSASIDDNGVSFKWLHQTGELFGTLCAPTRGWIAVGFNVNAAMSGTRFIIASVADEEMLVEEHVAMDSGHKTIEAMGLQPTLTMAEGRFINGHSCLSFSMTETIPGQPVLRLSKGSSVHVMLAWSRQPEFSHHSAWRRHYAIIL